VGAKFQRFPWSTGPRGRIRHLTGSLNPKAELTEKLVCGFRRYLGNAVNTLAVKLMLAKVYASSRRLPAKQALLLYGGAATAARFLRTACLFEN